MKFAVKLTASLFVAGMTTGVASTVVAGWVKGSGGPTPYPKYMPVPRAVAPTPPVVISPPGYMPYPPGYQSPGYQSGYQSGYRPQMAAPQYQPAYPAYPAYAPRRAMPPSIPPSTPKAMPQAVPMPGPMQNRAYAATAMPAAGANVTETAADTTTGNIRVDIANFQFGPQSVQIKPGQTVTWIQSDNAPHTVSGQGFDSGTLSNGQQFSRRFDQAGSFDYYCKLHPNMQATVIVSES